MIISSKALVTLLLLFAITLQHVVVYAFTITKTKECLLSSPQKRRHHQCGKLQATTSHEFDYLMQEVSSDSDRFVQPILFRRKILLTSATDSYDISKTILASSIAMPQQQHDTDDAVEEDNLEELVDDEVSNTNEAIINDDPYASVLNDQQTGKIQKFQEQKQQSLIETKLKSMDLQDIVLTLFIPGVLAFVGGRWVFNRANSKVMERKDDTLQSFAKEMLYHDGDYKEMELCCNDYKKKLVWLGPTKNEAMLKAYLEYYAKKKTVSPQAIASLSYAFTLFQLSEEKAAAILVSLCQQMGTDKISSAGKLLFLGSRIIKSTTGKAALLPIKELIMSTYREGGAVAETLIETSQQAMAEAAYRTAVLAAGKKQTSMTPGWEVLGLEKEHAMRIYEEEKKLGFVSERESMYGGQTRKYDKKGRQIDTKTGKLANPEEEDADDDNNDGNNDDGPVSNVYECGNCGFTMFIAQGRESKFFGDNFKCPECGAPKSDFKPRDPSED